jgi:hypothetical protein
VIFWLNARIKRKAFYTIHVAGCVISCHVIAETFRKSLRCLLVWVVWKLFKYLSLIYSNVTTLTPKKYLRFCRFFISSNVRNLKIGSCRRVRFYSFWHDVCVGTRFGCSFGFNFSCCFVYLNPCTGPINKFQTGAHSPQLCRALNSHSQTLRNSVLDAFTEFRKATINFVMFIRSSVCMEQFGSH